MPNIKIGVNADGSGVTMALDQITASLNQLGSAVSKVHNLKFEPADVSYAKRDLKGGGGLGTDFECDGGLIAHSLRGEGFDASEDGTGRGTPLVPVVASTLLAQGNATGGHRPPGTTVDTADSLIPISAGAHAPTIAFDCKASGQNGFGVGEIASTMRSMGHTESHQNGGGHLAVAFSQNQRDEVRLMQVAGALAAEPGAKQQTFAMQGALVRRLTPLECERLQGFPDDYTRVIVRGKPAADGPRYKALGNSMAVPVMHWIGKRIDLIESLPT